MWYFGNTESGPDLLACIWLSDEKNLRSWMVFDWEVCETSCLPGLYGLTSPPTEYAVRSTGSGVWNSSHSLSVRKVNTVSKIFVHQAHSWHTVLPDRATNKIGNQEYVKAFFVSHREALL